MRLIINWFYFFGFFCLTAYANLLPETFKTCKKSDPNYKPCLRNAIESAFHDVKNGLASLNVPKIDPLAIEKLHISGNGGKVDVDQDNYNLKVYGFANTKIEDAALLLDGNDCRIVLNALIPKLELIGQYKMVGKVLILQINGEGNSNITLVNLHSNHEVFCEKTPDKSGKQILKLTKYNMDLKTEQIYFDFENLVAGNAQMSEEVLKVMNDNSLEIFEEIRKDYAQTFAVILKRIAALILSKVPYEEYYLP